MKINIKLLIIILLSIFSAGYVIITSRKIDNLKREILIEKAKNNRIIDSLINENKINKEVKNFETRVFEYNWLDDDN